MVSSTPVSHRSNCDNSSLVNETSQTSVVPEVKVPLTLIVGLVEAVKPFSALLVSFIFFSLILIIKKNI